MKKVIITLALLSAFCSCDKNQFEDKTSSATATNQIVINVHDFTSEDGETKATYSSGTNTVTWNTGDELGVVPTNLTGQEATQVKFTINSSDAGKATATFNGTGWGMITTGDVQYSSYYPFKDDVDIQNIVVSYPVTFSIGSSGGTSQLKQYLYMYSKPITPSNPEGCTFDFYQLSAISKFTVNVPNELQTKTFISAKIIASDAVFAGTVSYDLTSVTTAEGSKPTFTGSNFYTTIDLYSIGTSKAFTGKSSYVLYIINAPAQLTGISLTVMMKDSDGQWYSGSVGATKDQECGTVYSYTITLNSTPVTLEMNAVDLGLSVLWGDRNVGATSLYDNGNYYAWGAQSYTDTNPYWDGSDYTKYNTTDNLYTLESSDDIATITYGNGWRMPSYSEIQELINNCNVSEAANFGVGNFMAVYVSSKTDASKEILMPLTGQTSYGTYSSSSHHPYWTSNRPSTSYTTGYRYYFDKSDYHLVLNSPDRRNRYTVRPVKDIPTKSPTMSGNCADELINVSNKTW